ncbi:hypothetical protein RPHASCH2410_CH19505 [Rhizobium phaseoli Ch24-10]|nr:hypothetical protein RPHASCH2410_CH19505 [Rhizobium phaseoli Ch24-10]
MTAGACPPGSKKPRQSLAGLFMLKMDRYYVLGGINDWLLPPKAGANLARSIQLNRGSKPAASSWSIADRRSSSAAAAAERD